MAGLRMEVLNGDLLKEEISDMTKWVNQYLSLGGFRDYLVTDFATDLADGITLLRLVQSLSGTNLPRHVANPMMRVQRIENFNMLLEHLKKDGLLLTVHAEDLAGANAKSLLVLLKSLKKHFTSGPQPEKEKKKQPSFTYRSVDKEDIAILSWAGEMVHKTITNYSSLYDGGVLCDIVNTLKENTFSEKEISNWTPEQRIRQALSASENQFFVPHSIIDTSKVSSGTQDSLLRGFLEQLKTVASSRQNKPRALRMSRTTGSYTDLTKSSPMVRPLNKHSSTEVLHQGFPGNLPALDRHHSVDTGIAPLRKNKQRSSSQIITSSSMASRHSSASQSSLLLDQLSGRATTNDDLSLTVTALEERLAALTAQFLFERHDIYKKTDRALVRERRKRQMAEKRLSNLEEMTKGLKKHYDACLLELAKKVSLLSGQTPGGDLHQEIEKLQQKVHELSTQAPKRADNTPKRRPRSQTLFVRKSSEKSTVFSKGSLTSFKKLKNFFGEEPPRAEDISSFLESLGYSHLIQLFTANDVSLEELSIMKEQDLQALQVPLGPRLRILQELNKLKPLTADVVI